MTTTSTLSNFFSNLQNHITTQRVSMTNPKTKTIQQVVELLINEGFLRGYVTLQNQKILIFLKYKKDLPYYNKIKFLSKPGKRQYVTNAWLNQQKANQGIYIVSTSKGFMTHYSAIHKNVGGELICQIS